jgi:hypothetical protein
MNALIDRTRVHDVLKDKKYMLKLSGCNPDECSAILKSQVLDGYMSERLALRHFGSVLNLRLKS